MKTYDKQYIKDCILNKKVIPPIIRKEIYIEILKSITNRNENFICIALENYISNNYNIDDSIMEKLFDCEDIDYKYAKILPEFNRNNINKYANLFNDTYNTFDYAWFHITEGGREDRITFIKLMINLVNKEIKQENN